MRTELKKLALAADPVYRHTDTDYVLAVDHKETKRSRDALEARCVRSGAEYSLHDGYMQVYVTADDLAECGLTDDDMLVEDMREHNKRREQEHQEYEQREREKEARLVGQYEAKLALYLDDPRERLELAKSLVEAAKEVL
jgi:hypothetical protein